MSVTAIITSIPPRATMLADALTSVTVQTHLPDEIITTIDHSRLGPAAQRNRAVTQADTEWVAFLDDDDIWYPNHLATLLDAAAATNADVIYPWFHIRGPSGEDLDSHDPLAINGEPAFERPFDAVSRKHLVHSGNFIPVTALVRTSAFHSVGGFPQPGTPEWPHTECEDWGLWQALARWDAEFHHVPVRTWEWRWHGKNTSGRPDRW